MATVKHPHTIHIDAPVAKVFDYIQQPKNFVKSLQAARSHPSLRTVTTGSDGAVESYEVDFRELGIHVSAVFTREEYVENDHFSDRSSGGPLFTISVAPDDGGTALTYAWESSKFDEFTDAVLFHGDKQLAAGLPSVKEAVEAMA